MLLAIGCKKMRGGQVHESIQSLDPRPALLLEAFSRCFFKYLQLVLLFASFVLIFEVKQLILVAYVVRHYKSSQIFSLKKS